MPKIYVGADNKARKSKRIYVGVNNVAERCKKIYVGDANNRARLAFCDLPTTILTHKSPEEVAYFDYENERHYLYEEQRMSFDLKNVQDIIRVKHDQDYPGGGGGQYDYNIEGGELNEVYVMPPNTYFWDRCPSVPKQLEYTTSSNNNGYVEKTNRSIVIHTGSINSPNPGDTFYTKLTFYCPYRGLLTTRVVTPSIWSGLHFFLTMGNTGSETSEEMPYNTAQYRAKYIDPGYVSVGLKVIAGISQWGYINDLYSYVDRLYVY